MEIEMEFEPSLMMAGAKDKVSTLRVQVLKS